MWNEVIVAYSTPASAWTDWGRRQGAAVRTVAALLWRCSRCLFGPFVGVAAYSTAWRERGLKMGPLLCVFHVVAVRHVAVTLVTIIREYYTYSQYTNSSMFLCHLLLRREYMARRSYLI